MDLLINVIFHGIVVLVVLGGALSVVQSRRKRRNDGGARDLAVAAGQRSHAKAVARHERKLKNRASHVGVPAAKPDRAQRARHFDPRGHPGYAKATALQRERLASIENERHVRTLLECIQRGESIPEFAWRDLPELTVGQEDAIRRSLAEMQERASRRGMKTDEYFESMAGYDASDLLEAAADRLGLLDCLIDEPIDDVQALETIAPDIVKPLFSWGIYNPAGSTTASLSLVEEAEGMLIFFSERHPMARQDIVFGFIPPEIAQDPANVACILAELASRNGAPSHALISGSLPTYVHLEPDCALSPARVREVFRRLSAHALPEDLVTAVTLLRQYRGRPAKRAGEEAWIALQAAGSGEGTGQNWPPDDELWADWWQAVTDPVHVASEIREIRTAS